jgi:hypothetical protein
LPQSEQESSQLKSAASLSLACAVIMQLSPQYEGSIAFKGIHDKFHKEHYVGSHQT